MTAFKLTKHTGRLPLVVRNEDETVHAKRLDGRLLSHLRPGGIGDDGGAVLEVQRPAKGDHSPVDKGLLGGQDGPCHRVRRDRDGQAVQTIRFREGIFILNPPLITFRFWRGKHLGRGVAHLVRRRTEELKENSKSRKTIGRPIEYCSIADIGIAREWVEAHRANSPDWVMTADSPELTTAENHFRQSPLNMVGGETVNTAEKWMVVKGKGGTRWTVLTSDGKKPIAFIAVGMVRWVSLAQVTRFGAFDMTVEVEDVTARRPPSSPSSGYVNDQHRQRFAFSRPKQPGQHERHHPTCSRQGHTQKMERRLSAGGFSENPQ
jgi:hypothetical protein